MAGAIREGHPQRLMPLRLAGAIRPPSPYFAGALAAGPTLTVPTCP
jgi:hypothetical protein